MTQTSCRAKSIFSTGLFVLLFLIGSHRAFSADLKKIQLLPPDKTAGLPVMQAFAVRASVREWADEKLTDQELSNLLWAADGINRPEKKMRTASSARNAQDIDIYVFTQEGVYLYDAESHSLLPVAKGDQRKKIASQAYVETAPVNLVLVSDFSKLKGDEAGIQKCAAADAGIVSQNISIFCAGMGLGTVPRLGMNEEILRPLLKLKDAQHFMLNNPVGHLKAKTAEKKKESNE